MVVRKKATFNVLYIGHNPAKMSCMGTFLKLFKSTINITAPVTVVLGTHGYLTALEHYTKVFHDINFPFPVNLPALPF